MAKTETPQREHPPVRYFTTGSTLLDLVVGGGLGMGFPAGRIVNFVGDKSSGKTFLALEMLAANAHRIGPKFQHNYDDSETGCTFDTQNLYGLDLVPEDSRTSETVEEMDANVGLWLRDLKKGQCGIYVVDSLDGLSDADKEARSEERMKALESGKEVKDKGTFGMGTPKFLSQEFFKTKTMEFADKDALLLIISQVRDNLDAFSFKKYTRSGGKALDFYAHTVVWLANVTKIKVKDRVVGVVIEAKTEKSKTPRPYRSCRLSVYFDYGVDNIGSNLDYLFDLRGKQGELLKVASNVPWDAKPANKENMTAFLESAGLLERVKEEKKRRTKSAQLSMDFIDEWLDEYEMDLVGDELKAHMDRKKEFFGRTYTRDELIREIESNPEMEAELERRVIAKWEEAESEIKTDRRSKYARI